MHTRFKVIHSEYYKHLKEAAQTSNYGRKNGLVSGRLACRSSKTYNLKQYRNQEFNPEFSIQFRMCFHLKNLKSERNNS